MATTATMAATKCERKSVFHWYHGDTNEIQIFYSVYSYVLKDIMRESAATEQEDLCIFINLNAALLGPPGPKCMFQSVFAILFCVCTFSNFQGGGGEIPLSPPPPPPPGSPPLPACNLLLYCQSISFISPELFKVI